MITKTALTLVCLAALIVYNNATYYETTTPSPTCNQETCDACPTCTFPTEDVTVSQLVSKSPFVVHLLSNDSISNDLASQCFTYVKITDDLFAYFITDVMRDGTTVVNVLVIYDDPRGVGKYWIVGVVGSKPFTPIIAVGNVLKGTCSGDYEVYSGMTVTTAEGCPTVPHLDPYLVFGPSTQPDENCLTQAENYLKTFSGDTQILRISTSTPIKCVASVLGIPVINSDTLSSNPDFQPISFP